MSKDNKNTFKKYFAFKTMITIAFIAFLTYAVMAVITHFSLNLNTENYSFSKSLASIFNTNTAIFKFFIYFMILNVIWISIAVSIFKIKKLIAGKK